MIRAVRAPGKALLLGEYAVLDGATAIVAAVDRYAVAWVPEDNGEAPSPFVAEATASALVRLGEMQLPAPARAPVVDSSRLYAGRRKLGLGSSAAVTVAAHGAVLHHAGVALDVDRRALFHDCDAAHARAQGTPGSGVDVAASVYGGVIAYTRSDALEVFGIVLPSTLAITLVDTGVAVATAPRVARWRQHAADHPDTHRSLVERMRQVALRFLAATSVEGSVDPYDVVREWNAALDDLARTLDLEMATPAHRRIDERARAAGGVAKPSGAGGGDLAVCFTPPDAVQSLREALARDGFDALDLAVGAPGLAPIQLEKLAA